jgi:hypothetical protein
VNPISAYLDQLKSQNVETRGFRFAKSTKSNVLSHIRQWLYFTTYFNKPVLPASAVDLSLFMELMSKTCGYDHCKSVLSSIKYLHSATDQVFPSNNFGLEETLQGLKRRKAGTPKRVVPIDPVILRRMFHHVNLQKLQDLSLWCGFLIAFFCLFRKANVCPDPACVLTRGDIMIDEEGKNVLIFVNFSKTNQYKKNFHVIPIPHNSDPALDLYTHLKSLFTLVQVEDDAPALSYGPKNFIAHRVFTTRLTTLLSKAGFDPTLYSGHSFRRRGASYLYSIGGTTLMVQVLGDWASRVFTRYLLLSLDDRLDAQNLISRNINATVGQDILPQ